MPSPYCNSNPLNFYCSSNPNYQPTGGGGWLNPLPNSQQIFNFPNTGGSTVYNPEPVYNPSATILTGGTQIAVTPLDKILAAILSGTALLTRQPYVPTNIQPQQGVDPNTLALLFERNQFNNSNIRDDGTAAGKVENWLKENTGVALLGAGAIVLFLMKPPSRSR